MLASETGLAQGIERDYFSDIGVKPFINAAAAYSALGGRNMWPEVVEAMEYARERNVIMEELQDAVGKRLASLIWKKAHRSHGRRFHGLALGLFGKDLLPERGRRDLRDPSRQRLRGRGPELPRRSRAVNARRRARQPAHPHGFEALPY